MASRISKSHRNRKLWQSRIYVNSTNHSAFQGRHATMWRSIGSPKVSSLRSLPILTLVSLFALSVTEAGQRGQTQASDESTGLRLAAAWMYDPPPPPPTIEQPAPTTPPLLKRLRITVTKRRPVPEPKQLYCVRLCDGFYFPMTTLASASASREAGLCNALCPDAQTAVYTLSTAEDGINAATTRIGGKVYNSLATAFAYRRGVSPHCACHQPGYPKLALSLDLTLKAGDIVVTDKGVRQFRVAQLPLRREGFHRLRQRHVIVDAEVSRHDRPALPKQASCVRAPQKQFGAA